MASCVDFNSYPLTGSSPYSIPSNVRPGPHRIHIKAELNNVVFARHQMSFFKGDNVLLDLCIRIFCIYMLIDAYDWMYKNN